MHTMKEKIGRDCFEFAGRYHRWPKRIYLGASDYSKLTHDCFTNIRSGDKRPEVLGLEVYVVDADSHFEIT